MNQTKISQEATLSKLWRDLEIATHYKDIAEIQQILNEIKELQKETQ